MIYFCPGCWNEYKEDFEKCPVCGYNIGEFEKLSYEDKLILALNHPIADFRLNAIKQLGNMSSEKVLPKFEMIINDENDIFILIEVVEALSKIPSKRSEKLLLNLFEHKSNIVSKYAKRTLKRFKGDNR